MKDMLIRKINILNIMTKQTTNVDSCSYLGIKLDRDSSEMQ